VFSHNKQTAANTGCKENTNIPNICAAAVRITKGLLGYGAENNWTDVQNSEGRSYSAGYYRRNWLYISAKDRLNQNDNAMSGDGLEETTKAPADESEKKSYFFYSPKFETTDAKGNFLARKAASAVMAHTGACDEHAYVLAMLLRHLLPIGTPINICGFKNDRTDDDVLHTFVIVGHVQSENPELTHSELKKYQGNDMQLVVDAWPILGGVVKLRDFWLRLNSYSDKNKRADINLRIDHTFLADGKDHLIKRVLKQRALLAASQDEKSSLTFNQSGSGFYAGDLKTQKNITEHIKPVIFDDDEIIGMWHAPYVADPYQEPEGAIATLHLILKQHSALKDLLIWVDEELGDDVSERIGSGVAPLSRQFK
jgi:hypothetical protein